MIKIDKTDKQILRFLQKDSNITIRELSKALSLSTTPIFKRIKRMEELGIIEGYHAKLNPEKLGKKLFAFVQVSLKEHTKAKVHKMMDKLVKMDEIQECHYVTGGADLLLKVLVKDMEAYNHFVTEKLFTVSNISRIESLLSLTSKKNTFSVSITDE